MRRTLKLLGLIGVAAAAGVAAAKRNFPVDARAADHSSMHGLPSVSHELRHALNRFEERFGA